jgi:serine/threonine protein kinase
MRLKIAAKTAIALAYLHLETSIPIFHRDVNTTNILLDDNYTAKVADFGASRLISLDQTQVTTLVQGTLKKKKKGDVYSFGVVLAELLAGKKVVFLNNTGRERKLPMYFVSVVKEDRVLQIVENHIVNEGNVEELKEVS